MHRPTEHFSSAANRLAARALKKRGSFPAAYDALVAQMESIFSTSQDDNAIEPDLRQCFREFLTNCGYKLALKNFDALLAEKSGDKFLRNDGTINWYHEFEPIMGALSMARKGRRGNGFDTSALQEYGGLEVLIMTHMRHDSIEDFVEKDEFEEQQYKMVAEIAQEGDTSYIYTGEKIIQQVCDNIDLMSQKLLTDDQGNIIYHNGKAQKEDVFTYISRLVYSSKANPIPFLLKQLDINHNFATMLGAGKFPPDRRAKRCNEKENMYGSRQSFYTDALQKWKPFAKAFAVLDGVMGEAIYKHFRYLENVDLFYSNSQDAFRRQPNDYPVSSEFLKNAMLLDMPERIHPLHRFLKRMQVSVDRNEDPEKYDRLQNFMEKVIKPSLVSQKGRFPYLFSPPQIGPQAVLSPIALG